MGKLLIVAFAANCVLLGAGNAEASVGKYTCVAKATAAPPRQSPRAASGSGATVSLAQSNAIKACQSANGGFASGCMVTRCVVNR